MTDRMMQFFAYAHLPSHLQTVSKPFGDLWADEVSMGGATMKPVAIEDRFPNAGQRDVMRALFFHGPLWDGDIPSKADRTRLHERGFVARHKGWNTLTQHGFESAITCGLGAEKEAWENERRNLRSGGGKTKIDAVPGVVAPLRDAARRGLKDIGQTMGD